jgi:predicted ribosome quality control (RQC) complex YloA/Tae2 family protein
MVVKLRLYIEEYERNFDILIGKNQKENDNIIKISNPNDIWFHLESISSPHIILITEDLVIPKRILNYIGTLFAKYKNNLPNRYNVIYTEVKNVKLTNVLGTVIPRNTKTIKY